jgi:glycosyltransferase involved in cell wall biosynthesis
MIVGIGICYLEEMIMNKKITFVLPSRNNLEFLQLAYDSIRNLETKHEVLVLDDASTDGTSKWIASQQVQDECLMTYHNPGPRAYRYCRNV